ncbi:glycosyltransferase [Glycomyces tritici]|uniref:Glycosyltransferase n=1 Tax=Glycomyces tritici TaxID=2665176 RepID=A0ABT7YPT8_9ACTN|nr:glycosyltransferase [Glycomyces tritici]MDN3240424.1 glycosyltransferase [Glycomyces tritici]
MTLKVSVVVPVYNPGPYIEDCIESLVNQSLPADEFEVVFVDDGSSDETPARLDALAAEHANVQVIHQEPSGWSGKPRNVGIEASKGEYVMFVDNDDYLGTEALERMYDYGTANGADVIIGKMAGKGRPVPLELFRKNIPVASVDTAPLMDSLTPHKMVRREFMDRIGLRFPEGRRRLEDHVFVTEAYLAAANVSVIGDYLCYYHVKRDDASNAGFRPIDPVGYFDNLREALDVVERYTEPGRLRDKLYRRWLRNEMVERMRGRRLLNMDPEYRKEMYDAIRGVVMERFGPGVDAGMAPTQQVAAALIRADRFADLEALAEWESSIKPHGTLDELSWEDGLLRLAFTAEYQADEEPLRFTEADGEVRLAPPLAEDTLEAIREFGPDTSAWFPKGKVDFVVRERDTAAEFYQPVELERETVADGEGVRILLHGKSSVDPASAAGGAPLRPGIWDVFVRISLSGWTKETRLGSVRAPGVEAGAVLGLAGGRPVLPYWTEPHGNLSLGVEAMLPRAESGFAGVTAADAVVDGGRLALPLPVYADAPTPAVLRLTGVGEPVELAAEVVPAASGAVLEAALDGLAAGNHKVAVVFGSGAEKPRKVALPLVLTADGQGSVVVRDKAEVDGESKRASGKPKASLPRRAVRKLRRILRG